MESLLTQIKNKYKIPIICLMRDCKEKNSIKSLKGNFISLQKPQKINSLANTENCTEEINILKD